MKKANMNVNCEFFFVSIFRNCFCESLMRTKAHKKFDGYHKYTVHVGERDTDLGITYFWIIL